MSTIINDQVMLIKIDRRVNFLYDNAIIAGSSNGRTWAFEAQYLGSSPSPAALRQGSVRAINREAYMKNWYVYLLLCDQKTFYAGLTDDVKRRFSEHCNKESFFTKKFSELTLVYCEIYGDKHKAAEREQQLKGWSKAKKQMLIDGKLGINRIEPAEVLG